MKKILLTLLLGACGSVHQYDDTPNQLEKPGQMEAMLLVWHGQLSMEGPPPEVEWTDGEKCKDLPGLSIVANLGGAPACLAGLYVPGTNVVHLVRSASPTLAKSPLAHEYMHAYLDYTTSDADGGHRGAEWSRVPGMRAELEEHGL